MPTKTEAIKNFLLVRTHKDLANLYNHGMECQVNVAQDGGERVEGDFKGRKWHGWSDGATTWKSFRIPFKANSEPEYQDTEIKFDLAEHAEAIGMTGWDWKNRRSKWVAFDFDSILGHTDGLTNEELQDVKDTASKIEWVTVRKSTSGKGIHLYVFLPDVPTANHNEHAALGRSILGKLSALTAFDFSSKVDSNSGNMWVYHRKMAGTDGLRILKQGIPLLDIPANWRDHIKVVTGTRRKNLPQEIEENGTGDLFEEMIGQRPKVKLDEEHQKLIQFLKDTNAMWWWDQDHHMLVTHTIHLQEAYESLGLRGYFKTKSTGKEKGRDQNCFASPIRMGGWIVRRFTPGVQEHESWNQDGAGWTRCYLNREPDIQTACRAYGGLEDKNGAFVFREAEIAIKAAELLGVRIDVGTPLRSRETKLKQHKDGRLLVQVEYKGQDRVEEMQGWLPEKDSWTRIYSIRNSAPTEPDVGNYDDLIRHLVTDSGEDYGWMLRSDGEWRNEPLAHARVALGSMGLSGKEITSVLGASVFRCWKVVSKPFQPEYPGDREWNRNAAQLKFTPTKDIEELSFPTWKSILEHCGEGLNDAIKSNAWAKANGILTGGEYLKCWIASLFQQPMEPLPYLFFYGPQNSGKSIFHEALALLLTKGYKRADAALVSQAGFNGELEGAIIAVVEETDLRKNISAYNRIKDWVTSRDLLIHCKGKTPYHIPNTSHWIHCIPEDQWILTGNGPNQVKDLIDKDVTIIKDGKGYKTTGFFKTRYTNVYKLTTKDGYSIIATDNHLIQCTFEGMTYWQELGKIMPGTEICLNKHIDRSWDGSGTREDGYLLGWLYGDGSILNRKKHHNHQSQKLLYVYPPDYSCMTYLEHCLGDTEYTIRQREDNAYTIRGEKIYQLCEDFGLINKKILTDEILTASSDFIAGFISAMFDTDGTATLDRLCISLYQSDRNFLENIQRLLLYFGIVSHIYNGHKSCTVKIYKNEKETLSKNSYVLVIRKKSNLALFLKRIGFKNTRKQNNLIGIVSSWTRKDIEESYSSKVDTIKFEKTTQTYDITVPEVHAFDVNGIVAHNCANDHRACPIFTGDTRISMCFVDALDPTQLIPKKQIIPQLEKEAPDFLADIINLELPVSNDRLNVPAIETEDKHLAQRLNQTPLESFLSEKCRNINGKMIKFSDLYDKFMEWLDPSEAHNWSKIRVGRELPPSYPKGRIRETGQFYIGNICWANIEQKDPPGKKLVLKDEYLEVAE